MKIKRYIESGRILRAGMLALLMLLSSWTMAASEERSNMDDHIGKKFIFNLAQDFKDVVVSPKDWEGPDIFRLAAVFGTGTVLFTLDQDIFDWFRRNRTAGTSDFFSFTTKFGDGGFLTGLMAAMYISGEIAGESSLRKTALLSLESFITANILTAGLKTVIGRARPKAWEGSQSFHLFSSSASHTSFPSGHSTSAFAVATSIAEQSESPVVDVMAYGLATLVSVSRVHEEKHWASDAFIGSAIGHFVAKKIAALDRGRGHEKVALFFQFSPKTKALTLTLAF